MHIKAYLEQHCHTSLYMDTVEVNPDSIQVVMINECAPHGVTDNFYGDMDGEYAVALSLLFPGTTPVQLLEQGIYITCLQAAKLIQALPACMLQDSSVVLEEELKLFKKLRVIMLMGDVAIHLHTMIAKRKHTARIPAGSTYKLRKSIWMDGEIRLFPSYIMTGRNLQIERSKRTMIEEDISQMLTYLETQKNG